MENLNDRQREETAKPQAGVVKTHHKTFEDRDDQPSKPNADGTVHNEKAVGHEAGNVANPSASGPIPTSKDKAHQATPNAGSDHDMGKTNRKTKFDAAKENR